MISSSGYTVEKIVDRASVFLLRITQCWKDISVAVHSLSSGRWTIYTLLVPVFPRLTLHAQNDCHLFSICDFVDKPWDQRSCACSSADSNIVCFIALGTNHWTLTKTKLDPPHTNGTILARLRHVSVSYTYTLHNGRCLALFGSVGSGAAVPLARLELIVYLDDILACGTHYPAAVKRHTCDRVVVGEGVVQRASPKIPYLRKVSTRKTHADRKKQA